MPNRCLLARPVRSASGAIHSVQFADRAAAECDSTRQKEAPLLNKAESRPSAEHGARLRAPVGRGMRSRARRHHHHHHRRRRRRRRRCRRKPNGIVDLGRRRIGKQTDRRRCAGLARYWRPLLNQSGARRPRNKWEDFLSSSPAPRPQPHKRTCGAVVGGVTAREGRVAVAGNTNRRRFSVAHSFLCAACSRSLAPAET